MGEHLVQRDALDETCDEVTVRRPDGVVGEQVDRDAHRRRLLAHGSVVVAGELALLEEDTRALLQHAALEHGRVELQQLVIRDEREAVVVRRSRRGFDWIFGPGGHKVRCAFPVYIESGNAIVNVQGSG